VLDLADHDLLVYEKFGLKTNRPTGGWTMTTEDNTHDQKALDPQLLAILCCPESKQEVSLLDHVLLEKLNKKIETGELYNKGGSVVKEKLDGGLLRADQIMVYPIRDGIPILLIEEGISVKGLF